MTSRKAPSPMILVMTLVMAAISIAAPNASAQNIPQTKWVGDVPIMQGLTIEPNLGFAFDSPEGRIVIIYLRGDTAMTAIKDYYNTAMPPLGWGSTASTDKMSWSREGEALTITPTTAADAPLWKITIRPE